MSSSWTCVWRVPDDVCRSSAPPPDGESRVLRSSASTRDGESRVFRSSASTPDGESRVLRSSASTRDDESRVLRSSTSMVQLVKERKVELKRLARENERLKAEIETYAVMEQQQMVPELSSHKTDDTKPWNQKVYVTLLVRVNVISFCI